MKSVPSSHRPGSAVLVPACAVLACLLAAAAPAAAPPLTVTQARAAAEEIARLVGAHYVVPEKRAVIAGALRSAAAAKRYDVEEPRELAQRLTEDLKAAGHDGHLYVHYQPEAYQALLREKGGPGASEYDRQAGRRSNQGFEEMRILDGNVRYARISGFLWSNDATGRVIDEAARFLGDGDAVLVDLRGNGGGSADAVKRLVSYFFSGEDQPLISFYDGMSGETSTNRVSNDLPNPRMVGRPLYVLTDAGTASAAEEFAYHVKLFELGTLVGRTTAGAANNNALFPVAPGFVASVSVGRPIHPVSRSNWEGEGIAPDVATAPAAALDQAHLMALDRLAERAGEPDRGRYAWARAGVEARLRPVRLSGRDLRDYVGVYGIRTIRLDKDTLVYQREGREPTTLVPMAPDLFAFPDTADVRVKFRRSGGKVVGFDQVTSDGQVIPSERTG